jgi:hypothetical protein
MAAHLLTRTGAATGSANQLAASGTHGRASAGPVVLTAAIEGEQARLLAIPARNGGRPVTALAGTSTGIAQAAGIAWPGFSLRPSAMAPCTIPGLALAGRPLDTDHPCNADSVRPRRRMFVTPNFSAGASGAIIRRVIERAFCSLRPSQSAAITRETTMGYRLIPDVGSRLVLSRLLLDSAMNVKRDVWCGYCHALDGPAAGRTQNDDRVIIWSWPAGQTPALDRRSRATAERLGHGIGSM